MPTLEEYRLTLARAELGWLTSAAIRLLGADAGSVGIPEGIDGLMRLGAMASPDGALEFIRIDATDTFGERVVTGGCIVDVSASSLANTAGPDTFMRASELHAFLGAPMIDPSGARLGMMAVMTHEDRIWSRHDVADLSSCARLGAHAIAGHACPDTTTVARAVARP